VKRYLIAVLSMGLGIGTAGCPSSSGPSGAQTFRAGDADSLVHEQSGIPFPARLGDFAREGTLKKYVADGSDVSAGYNYVGPDGAIAATTYVYPSPKLVSIGSPQHVIDHTRAKLSDDEFARSKQELQSAHPQAVLVSEGSFTTGSGRSGLMAEYEYTGLFAGAVQPVKSRLYLLTYINGRWTVKHRITFPAGRPVQPKVDQYVRDFGPTAAH
jgi:hypothetical protein